MGEPEKSKSDLSQEIVTLRNQINSLKFEAKKKDHQAANQGKENDKLETVRNYAVWVVYASPAAVCALAPNGTPRFINPACEKLTGYRADELLVNNWWKLLYPGDDYQQVIRLFRQFEKGDVQDCELAHVMKGGQKRTLVWQSLNRLGPEGKLDEVILVGIDVSARKRVESQLESSEEKFRTLISNIPCAVYRCLNDDKWTMLHMTDHIEAISGYTSWDLVENRIMAYHDVIHPDDREKVRHAIDDGVGHRESFILEYRICHADGSVRWVHEKGQGYFDKKEELKWIDGVIFDITDRKEMEKRLEETLLQVQNLSLTDELTDLYNRRGFITHAEQQLKIAERNGRPLTIVFVDLNGMKAINDVLGHKIGDQALVETANVLQLTFRKADVVARLGGDEFAVLAVETDEEKATAMTVRLQEKIGEYNAKPDKLFTLSMSTGIAEFDPQNPTTIDKLLERADKRMYEMKVEMKKNRIV